MHPQVTLDKTVGLQAAPEARGAMRMGKRRVIVKRLASIQNLGSMDVHR